MSNAESQLFEPNSARFTDFLSKLKVTMVKIEDWVILQRSRFDITMDDEPFTALQLYLNTQTRAYITRVWARTFSKGTTTGSMTEIEVLCNQTFAQGMSCCPGTSGKEVENSLVSVNYPFTRLVSQNCTAFHKSNAPCGVHLPVAVCSECIASSEAPTVIKEEEEDIIHPSDLYPEVQVNENACENTKDIKVDPEDHVVQEGCENIEDNIKDESNVENVQSSPFKPKEAIIEANAKYAAWLENENIELPRVYQRENHVFNEKTKTGSRGKSSYTCPKCDYVVISKTTLINHIKTVHYGLKPFKCDECPYSAGYKNALESHKKRKHGGAKEKKCLDCEYSAYTDRELESHITRVHVNENVRKPGRPIGSSKIISKDGEKTSHTCTLCDFTTTSNKSLVNHILDHNGLQPYKCDECPFEAGLKVAMDIHKETEHPNNVSDKIEVPKVPKPYRMVSGRKQQTPDSWKQGTEMMDCEHCGKSLVRQPKLISRHYRRFHLWGNFYCTLCEFFSYYPKEYATHMLERHSDMDSGIAAVCCECGEEVQLKGDVDTLAEHYKDCAIAWENMRRTIIAKNNQSKVKTVEMCHICGKGVRGKDTMRGHLRNHRDSKSFNCKYVTCAILFPTIEEKRKHERFVHKPREHCDQCGRVFIGRGQLKWHIISVHERKSLDLKCTFPECDKLFTNRAQRTTHRNLIHTPNKYKCEVCSKTCGSLQQLRDHRIVHTGERNFQCQDCDRKFKKRDDLTDHRRKHEKTVEKQKPFACQYCPYRGGSSSLLYHHKKQKHKSELQEEKKEREKSKIKVSSVTG